jgi:hypothetical protein
VAVACGESACGADHVVYSCSQTGWTWTGQSCTGNTDAGPPCQCTGTGPNGGPVTVNCGESACGSDYTTYLCGASGWSHTGQSCGCTCTGTGPNGVPVTVTCGESACGSDLTTYLCSASGWAPTGQSCTCTCTGTGPGGVPVTVVCGESACGSDNFTYACSHLGWAPTGQSCPAGTGGAGGGTGGAGGGTGAPCECVGTGPGGVPLTATCGTSACGSDDMIYLCNADSTWSWTGQACLPNGTGGAGTGGAGGGGTGGTGGGTGGSCNPDAATSLDLVATEMVGRPTAQSITVSAVAPRSVEAYVEYGTTSGALGSTTPAAVFADGLIKTVIAGLNANTRYYYRMRYRPSDSCGSFLTGSEHRFQTQRPTGSTFTFDVQSDSH